MDNEQWFVLRSESRMIVPHLKTEFERRKRAVAEFGILLYESVGCFVKQARLPRRKGKLLSPF